LQEKTMNLATAPGATGRRKMQKSNEQNTENRGSCLDCKWCAKVKSEGVFRCFRPIPNPTTRYEREFELMDRCGRSGRFWEKDTTKEKS
jgi:hypothetical protein